MSGYIKTNWIDDVTPVSAKNLNNIEKGVYYLSLLDSDGIADTKPYYTKDEEGNITKIEHKETINESNIVRTDTFAYTKTNGVITQIVETRTLNTLEAKRYIYNFNENGDLLPGEVM